MIFCKSLTILLKAEKCISTDLSTETDSLAILAASRLLARASKAICSSAAILSFALCARQINNKVNTCDS